MRDDRPGGAPMMQQQEEFRNPNRPFGFQGSHHSVFDDILNPLNFRSYKSTNLWSKMVIQHFQT